MNGSRCNSRMEIWIGANIDTQTIVLRYIRIETIFASLSLLQLGVDVERFNSHQ